MAFDASEAATPLLDDGVDGVVDYKYRPVNRSKSGGWRSAVFISYLQQRASTLGPVWPHFCRFWGHLLPIHSSGLGLLTLSAVLPSFSTSDCQSAISVGQCSPPLLQIVFFFFSLYLVAFAQGGHKPCVQAFGSDQFDTQDPQECKAKSSFFNWWYFGLSFGTCVTLWILNYIQDNLSWGLGFGIPCMIMAFALIIFLLGTSTYRFSI